MGKIVILDENTSNKIAAGEVIEKPASVVKELIENSIDAGAGHISVEIKNGGISYIKVTDNGTGIDEDDVEIAFERHATSKIRNSDDLDKIKTMGFRGEALASIASVSSVELSSRIIKKTYGTIIKIQGGNVLDVKQIGCPVGTTIKIKDLFYNTPARFKFLKKDATEAGYVSEIISRIALGNPHISFRLTSNNIGILHTPGNNDLLSTIFSIYGKDIAHNVLKMEYENNKVKVTGYTGKPEIARSNRNQQSIFINGRYVRSKIISSAIDEAYNTYLMKNKFAFIVLNLEMNPALIDINVHPTKMEVKFSEEQEVFRCVYHSILNALTEKPLIKDIRHETESNISFNLENRLYSDKTNYIQQNFLKENPSSKSYSTENRMELPNRYEMPPSENNLRVNSSDTFEKEPGFEESKKKQMNFLSDARIIGQAFSTYIILQSEEGLLLIDQHAAHERILYEKLKLKFINKESLSQGLISPVAVNLTNQEFGLLIEEKEFFNKIGYNYEEFGNNSILLRDIPFVDDMNQSVKETFIEIIDFLINRNKSDYSLRMDETLHNIACKAAIKANKKLDDIEIRKILDDMSEIENPYTCPHGRPTIIKFTKYELEKMFKRIV